MKQYLAHPDIENIDNEIIDGMTDVLLLIGQIFTQGETYGLMIIAFVLVSIVGLVRMLFTRWR